MLQIVPCTIQDAKAYVRQHHRHLQPPLSGLYALAVADGDRICGVAIVGRPISIVLQDGWTAEVTRVATDGTKNACSKLYAAAWRAARAIGYRKIITYNLPEEGGASLRAAGYRTVAEVRGGRTWHWFGRPRVDRRPNQAKLRWERTA